jgi:hypothetical protein
VNCGCCPDAEELELGADIKDEDVYYCDTGPIICTPEDVEWLSCKPSKSEKKNKSKMSSSGIYVELCIRDLEGIPQEDICGDPFYNAGGGEVVSCGACGGGP